MTQSLSKIEYDKSVVVELGLRPVGASAFAGAFQFVGHRPTLLIYKAFSLNLTAKSFNIIFLQIIFVNKTLF